MLKKLKLLFFPVAIIFICSAFTGAYFSDSVSVSGNNVSAGTWATPTPTPITTPTDTPADVVINEFMANPLGDDDAAMPQGELVELFNKGGSSIDINGWYLYDADNTHALPIISGNVQGGVTVIAPGGYLIVFRNSYSFSLNNDGDTIRLYDGLIGSGSPVDSTVYASSTEDKTWAKVPDGTGAFTDNHTPTPGGPNV